MTKQEHINYWLENADRDWQRAERCFRDKDYVFCLFCLHLCLEKTLKALWVKYNEDYTPPRIHNLLYLLEKTPVKLIDEDLNFLGDMNKYQLEGRYPDYAGKLYKACTRKFTNELKLKSKKVRQCLLEELQKK